MDALTQAIGWICLILGAAAIIAGIVVALKYRNVEPPKTGEAEVGDQGLNETIDKVTEFAKALKDLDSSGRLLTIGVMLIAIAAVVAGLDSVAEAIKSAAS